MDIMIEKENIKGLGNVKNMEQMGNIGTHMIKDRRFMKMSANSSSNISSNMNSNTNRS